MLTNERPVTTVLFDGDVVDVVQREVVDVLGRPAELNTEVVLLTVPNGHETRSLCPYFWVFLVGLSSNTPINYNLESFLAMAQASYVTARARLAVVIGRREFLFGPLVTDVPYDFHKTNRDHLEATRFFENLESFDNCLATYPYMLLTPCQRCASLKHACNRSMPCDRCTAAGATCLPSVSEWVSRPRHVLHNLVAGSYYHCELARYQIHLEMKVLGRRGVLRKREQDAMWKRLVEQWGSEDGNAVFGDVDTLPPDLVMMKNAHLCHKIEWFYNGQYKIFHDEAYGMYIRTAAEIKNVSSTFRCCPRLVDDCRFGKCDDFFRLWCESLDNAGKVVACRGACLTRNTIAPRTHVLTMKSIVVSAARIVTFTSVTKSLRVVL